MEPLTYAGDSLISNHISSEVQIRPALGLVSKGQGGLAGSGLFSRYCLLPSGNSQLPELVSKSWEEARGLPGRCECVWGGRDQQGWSVPTPCSGLTLPSVQMPVPSSSPGARTMTVRHGLSHGLAVGTGAGMTGHAAQPPPGQPGLLPVRATGVPVPLLPCCPTEGSGPSGRAQICLGPI